VELENQERASCARDHSNVRSIAVSGGRALPARKVDQKLTQALGWPGAARLRWLKCRSAAGRAHRQRVSYRSRNDIGGALRPPCLFLWRWNGSEGIQKRERGPGCRDLALLSFDVLASGDDHPKPDEREGQTDEIDPETASDEHADEPD